MKKMVVAAVSLIFVTQLVIAEETSKSVDGKKKSIEDFAHRLGDQEALIIRNGRGIFGYTHLNWRRVGDVMILIEDRYVGDSWNGKRTVVLEVLSSGKARETEWRTWGKSPLEAGPTHGVVTEYEYSRDGGTLSRLFKENKEIAKLVEKFDANGWKSAEYIDHKGTAEWTYKEFRPARGKDKREKASGEQSKK